jgi:sulfotransferase family protein
LEAILNDLNSRIENIETPALDIAELGPIIIIMGCPRAGSTILLQWLASLGHFSYPSNLIARFYKNPYIGIRAQQALLEYDPLNQLGFTKTEGKFESSLGKTMGAQGPSEYWYFWRNYFKFDADSSVLTKEQLAAVDGDSFISKLSSFELLTGNPLVLKGMLLNYHIKFLYNLYPKFLFVNLTRDPYCNAQSLLLAREKYFGDRKKWYSFKPPEYTSLKQNDPIAQVAGQVIYTQKAVRNNLKTIPEKNVLKISYSQFCEDPNSFVAQLSQKYEGLGGKAKFNKEPFSKKGIINNNSNRLSSEDAAKLKEQISYFESLIKY